MKEHFKFLDRFKPSRDRSCSLWGCDCTRGSPLLPTRAWQLPFILQKPLSTLLRSRTVTAAPVSPKHGCKRLPPLCCLMLIYFYSSHRVASGLIHMHLFIYTLFQTHPKEYMLSEGEDCLSLTPVLRVPRTVPDPQRALQARVE